MLAALTGREIGASSRGLGRLGAAEENRRPAHEARLGGRVGGSDSLFQLVEPIADPRTVTMQP